MEDYVFLIIAIVLSVFGAINQNKKKKMMDDPIPDTEGSPRNSFMDQLLGNDFLSEPVVKQTPMTRINPMKVPVSAQSRSESTKDKFYHQVFNSTLPDRPKHERIQTSWKQKEELDDAEEESMNYLEDFSLKKAFVYSEIMNRKY